MTTLISGILMTAWMALMAAVMIASGVEEYLAIRVMLLLWGIWALGVAFIKWRWG